MTDAERILRLWELTLIESEINKRNKFCEVDDLSNEDRTEIIRTHNEILSIYLSFENQIDLRLFICMLIALNNSQMER